MAVVMTTEYGGDNNTVGGDWDGGDGICHSGAMTVALMP